MENIIFERTVSLDGAGKPELLQGTLYAAENQAHTFRITAVKAGAKVALAGTVSASFIRPNQETVVMTGSIDDGCAVVTLPQSCYTESGRFTLTIFATEDGVKVALFCLMGNVKQTTTDTIVDPGEVMPAYEDLIEEMEEVRDSIPADYTELSEDVADLKSAIRNNYEIESGAYSTTTGEKYNSWARLRNKNLILVGLVSSITVPSGYDFNVVAIGKDGTTVISTITDWITHLDVSTISASAHYIGLTIRKTSSPNADIRTDASTVEGGMAFGVPTIEKLNNKWGEGDENKMLVINSSSKVEATKDDSKIYRDGSYVYSASDIIQGSFNSAGAVVTNAKRMRMKTYVHVDSGDSIHFVPGANAAEMLYGWFNASKVYQEDSSWYTTETTVTFNSEGYIICVFRNGTNTDVAYTSYDATLIIENKNSRIIREAFPPSEIQANNKEVVPFIDGASLYGYNRDGLANPDKLFTILAITDTHGDSVRTRRAVEYSNAMPQIDAMIHLGDIVGANFNSPYAWFEPIVQSSEKPFYICLGNHDGGDVATDTSKGATVAQQFTRFISPNKNKIGINDLSVPWYCIDDATHNVTLICLDCYDLPDTLSDGAFVVPRNVGGYSQTQIDWLISTLASVPSGRHLLIAQHALFEAVTPDNNEWRNHKWSYVAAPSVVSAYDYKGMLMEIIEAWKTGTSLAKTYNATTTGMPNISVSADFTECGVGKFVGYLIGHTHWDQTGVITDFPTQHYYNLDTTALDLYQNKWSDLPRQVGTKCEDLITTVSIDTQNNRVKMVRVGTNETFELTERQKVIISYDVT